VTTAREFRLEIVTPEATIYRGAATSVIVPGTEGYLGVLAGHTPFITSLREGKLTFAAGDERREFRIGAGYIEVTPSSVIVITEGAAAVGPGA